MSAANSAINTSFGTPPFRTSFISGQKSCSNLNGFPPSRRNNFGNTRIITLKVLSSYDSKLSGVSLSTVLTISPKRGICLARKKSTNIRDDDFGFTKSKVISVIKPSVPCEPTNSCDKSNVSASSSQTFQIPYPAEFLLTVGLASFIDS